MENLIENGLIKWARNTKTQYFTIKHEHMWDKQLNIDVSREDEE
jgi:hypothetical protein